MCIQYVNKTVRKKYTGYKIVLKDPDDFYYAPFYSEFYSKIGEKCFSDLVYGFHCFYHKKGAEIAFEDIVRNVSYGFSRVCDNSVRIGANKICLVKVKISRIKRIGCGNVTARTQDYLLIESRYQTIIKEYYSYDRMKGGDATTS